MDFSLDMDTLKALVRLMADHGLHELEVQDDGKKIHLKRGESERHQAVSMIPSFAPPHAMPAAPAPAAHAPAAAPASPKPAGGPPHGIREVKSPMVGTFYRAPSPDAPPFVEVGDKVSEESVLCIIEAMKVMNEIKAECKGEIVKILVANGESVEYGQPLYQVKVG
jgi:acetyl-CoA carboxylase biotin carboxyl carrier protein